MLLSSIAQAAVVTPIAAEISYTLRINDRDNDIDLSQSNTQRLDNSVGNLSETSSLSNGGMTLQLNNGVSFGSAASGMLVQDYSNVDANDFGLSGDFTGRVTFTYQFSVDTATDVSIHYLATGSSTSPSTTPVVKWWAMQGFQIELRRDIGGPERLQLPFLGVDQLAPISYDDALVASVEAGTHELYFNLVGNASGNQPGDRAMHGSFMFQIGDEEPNPVPLPMSALLLLGVVPGLLAMTRKTQAKPLTAPANNQTVSRSIVADATTMIADRAAPTRPLTPADSCDESAVARVRCAQK